MLKRIAVGCDGTENAGDAVALGHALAGATGAGLTLVGAYFPSPFPVSGESDSATLRHQAEAALRHERDRRAPEAHVDTVTDYSFPRALRRYAERVHAGITVLGSSHVAPEGRVSISRRGRQLLSDVPFALALAASGIRRRPYRLTRIGVGYDGGPEAQAALDFAAALCRGASATLVVRRVVEDQLPALSSQQWLIVDWESYWEPERESALAETEAALAGLELPVEVSASIGDPGYELRELSSEVDLMVVGSRRWGPVTRLVTGGAGETLVADSASSLLVVPRVPVDAPSQQPTDAADAAATAA